MPNSDSDSQQSGILYDITKDILYELNKPKNIKKLKHLGNFIFNYNNVKIYLYTIILMLILIFVMNTVQFYYYITHVTSQFSKLPQMSSLS
jgi:hypothetical protein